MASSLNVVSFFLLALMAVEERWCIEVLQHLIMDGADETDPSVGPYLRCLNDFAHGCVCLEV